MSGGRDAHDHMHAHGSPNSPIGFTGERVLPDQPEWAWCFQAHKFGYDDLVARIEAGARVLDIGCGEGYGVRALAERAGFVVGCDYAEDAVRHAKGKYRAPNLAWVVCDAQRLPFAPEAFDVVSSLQVIEHFTDTDAHLDGVRRAMRRGAVHYCATPNIDNMSADEADNEFHLRDFTPDDLREALGRHFASVEVMGMFYREDSPRVRAMRAADDDRERSGRLLARTERLLAGMPGPLRVRLRRAIRRLARIADPDAARNAILAEDFEARGPAEESFCLIAIAHEPRADRRATASRT